MKVSGSRPYSSSRAFVLWWFAVGVMACTPPPSQVKVEDLSRQVAALRAQNAEYTRHIAELENQVFVLSDRAESNQVSQQRAQAPQLPRVTLTPGQPVPNAQWEDSGSYNAGEEDLVEYVGEAARSSKNRPMLRLVGNEGGAAAYDETAPVRPAAVMVSAPNPRRPAAAAVGSGETRKLNVNAPDATPIALYRQGLDHLKGGRHADAAAGFREFLRRYAQHDYADNAQYWLAECYYDLKDFVTAVSEFRKVVDGYPQGNKVPDALLKVGFAYLSLGNEPAGRSTLKELVRSYPTHPATTAAAEKLSELDGKPQDAAYAGGQGR